MFESGLLHAARVAIVRGMKTPTWCGPRGLITRAVVDLGGGQCRVFGARQFRKGIVTHVAPTGLDHQIPFSTTSAWRLSRWNGINDAIAILFMIGSSCFALGGVQAALPGSGLEMLRSTFAQNLVFFIGSIFFTTAAFLQWRQSVGKDLRKVHLEAYGPVRWWDWRPQDCGYMASITQFAGTILFNFNTGDALLNPSGWLADDALVWTPNMVGCVLFLVSSWYGCIEIGQSAFSWEPRNYSWWIAWSNMAGSVFFQLSAFLSVALPDGGLSDLGGLASGFTALGAVGFFVAALLMLPESRDVPTHPKFAADRG